MLEGSRIKLSKYRAIDGNEGFKSGRDPISYKLKSKFQIEKE